MQTGKKVKKKKAKVKACLEVPLQGVFKNTGLDLDVDTRRALMMKARKDPQGEEEEAAVTLQRRTRMILRQLLGERVPGALMPASVSTT